MLFFFVSDSWQEFASYRQSNPGPFTKSSFSSWKKNGCKDRPGFGKYWLRREKKINEKKAQKKKQKKNKGEDKKKNEKEKIEKPKLVMTFDGTVATIQLG